MADAPVEPQPTESPPAEAEKAAAEVEREAVEAGAAAEAGADRTATIFEAAADSGGYCSSSVAAMGESNGRFEAQSTVGRMIAANEGPWDDGLGPASPWAGIGTYCFNMPDYGPAAVGARIMVGSVLHATAVQNLQSLGITHVVNCAAGQCAVPVLEFHSAGMEYLGIEALDHEGYPLLWEHYPAVHAFLKPVLEGHGRALVHCVAGRNRSVTLAVAAVMMHEKVSLRSVVRRVCAGLASRSLDCQLSSVHTASA